MPIIKAKIATHVGLRRYENQDYCLAEESIGLFVVADGLGGCPAGGRASAEAVLHLQWLLADATKSKDHLEEAFQLTSNHIYNMGLLDPNLTGMATTMSAMWINGSTAYVAHVGDSRIYRLRAGKLKQITSDHSLLQELLDRGDSEAIHHPHIKHILVRTIGQGEVLVDTQTVDLRVGDKYLLCSDGLHGVLDEQMLRENLEGDDPEGFVRAANGMGGPDNITALVLEVF